MSDEPCASSGPFPFAKVQPTTTQLCGKRCSGQNLEIDCLTSEKVNTRTVCVSGSIQTNCIEAKTGDTVVVKDNLGVTGDVNIGGAITVPTSLFTNKLGVGPTTAFFDGAFEGFGPHTLSGNTYAITSSGSDLLFVLDNTVSGGCIIYVSHQHGSDGMLTVEGLGLSSTSPPYADSVTIPPGTFACFWFIQNAWFSSI